MRNSCIAALGVATAISTTAAAIFGLAIAPGVAITAGGFEQLAGSVPVANTGALRGRSAIDSVITFGNAAAAGGTTAAV